MHGEAGHLVMGVLILSILKPSAPPVLNGNDWQGAKQDKNIKEATP